MKPKVKPQEFITRIHSEISRKLGDGCERQQRARRVQFVPVAGRLIKCTTGKFL